MATFDWQKHFIYVEYVYRRSGSLIKVHRFVKWNIIPYLEPLFKPPFSVFQVYPGYEIGTENFWDSEFKPRIKKMSKMAIVNEIGYEFRFPTLALPTVDLNFNN